MAESRTEAGGATEHEPADNGAAQLERRDRNRGPPGVAGNAGPGRARKRAPQEVQEDDRAGGAAPLAWYGRLGLFPAIIALVSTVGRVGNPQATPTSRADIVSGIGPG